MTTPLSRPLCALALSLSLTLLPVTPASASPSLRFGGSGLLLSFTDSGIEGVPLEWWLVVATATQMLYYTTAAGWLSAASLGEVQPAIQTDALDFTDLAIDLPTSLDGAQGTAYFGVDFSQNGMLDTDSLVYDQTTFQLTSGF